MLLPPRGWFGNLWGVFCCHDSLEEQDTTGVQGSESINTRHPIMCENTAHDKELSHIRFMIIWVQTGLWIAWKFKVSWHSFNTLNFSGILTTVYIKGRLYFFCLETVKSCWSFWKMGVPGRNSSYGVSANPTFLYPSIPVVIIVIHTWPLSTSSNLVIPGYFLTEMHVFLL